MGRSAATTLNVPPLDVLGLMTFSAENLKFFHSKDLCHAAILAIPPKRQALTFFPPSLAVL